MADTITAFYDFSPGTKARSSEVDANFSNFRGDLIPIEPMTATGSHLTYDLGSTEYRWDVAYLRILDLIGATTTANLRIERDSAVTAGAFHLQIGSTTVGQIRSTGAWMRSNYVVGSMFTVNVSATAASPLTIPATVVSITSYGGFLEAALIPADTAGTSGGNSIQLTNNTAVNAPSATVVFYLDNTILSRHTFQNTGSDTTAVSVLSLLQVPINMRAFKFNVTAGGHTLYVTAEVNTTTSKLAFTNVQFLVQEK